MKELGENCYFNFFYLEQGRNANFELYSLLAFSGCAVYQGGFNPVF